MATDSDFSTIFDQIKDRISSQTQADGSTIYQYTLGDMTVRKETLKELLEAVRELLSLSAAQALEEGTKRPFRMTGITPRKA